MWARGPLLPVENSNERDGPQWSEHSVALTLMCITDQLTRVTVIVYRGHQLRASESKIKKERICFPFKKNFFIILVGPANHHLDSGYNQFGTDAIRYPWFSAATSTAWMLPCTTQIWGKKRKEPKSTLQTLLAFKATLSEMWELMSQPPVTSPVLSSRHRVSVRRLWLR